MRIAVWHNLPSGGGKRALYNHVKALKEKGHYLEAWTTDASADYLSLDELIIENRIPVSGKIKKASNHKSPVKRTQQKISVLKEHCALCVAEIEKGGFDIIFVNSCLYTYISYISLFSSIPTLLYLGEPFRLLYEAFPVNIWQAPKFPLTLKNINKFRRDFLLNYSRRVQVREEIDAAFAYDQVLVNSLFSKESVTRAYGIEPKVCYLGVDERGFPFPANQKEPYVVGLGKISDSKSVDKVILAVSNIRKDIRPAIKWISNGYDASYLDFVLATAKNLEVTFIPLINSSDEELKTVISSSAVMLYFPKLEPFGLAPLEANMCGTYVIAIAEGGIRESIKDSINGTLFTSFDARLVAEEIEKFITSMDFAGKKGQEARMHVESNWNFTFLGDNIEREMLSLVKVPGK